MPIARYFFFVGGVLLALLFAFDANAPKFPVADRAEAGIDMPVVRINSDRKWPAAVVFDTNIPTIVPAQLTAADVSVPAMVGDNSASMHVRNAFGQFKSANTKAPETKLQRKRKIAKSRRSSPTVFAAQQPRFSFLANN